MIINGPSLNMLGQREVDIYGKKTYQDLENTLKDYAKEQGLTLSIYQSNYEGIIIDLLQLAHQESFDAVLLNAGAFTHYSYALYDAIKSIHPKVIEVHLTDPLLREETFRHHSVIEKACQKTFKGLGFMSYIKALEYVKKELK